MYFAYKRTRTGIPLGSTAPKTVINMGIVEGDDIEDAVRFIVSRSSVGALKDGIDIEIEEISFTDAQKFHVQYDGDPWAKNTQTITTKK